MSTMEYTSILRTVTCWCGQPFAINANLYRHAVDDGNQTIYCPLGHTVSWSGSGYKKQLADAQAKLTAERNRLQATRDLLAAEERSHAATRGVVTRQKKKLVRVTNGVCPCCNRSFQNLTRHMQGQHPEYKPAVQRDEKEAAH